VASPPATNQNHGRYSERHFCPPSAGGLQVAGPVGVIHSLGWPQSLSLIGLTVRIVVLDPNIAMEDVPGW
jgi:hypothetical protein